MQLLRVPFIAACLCACLHFVPLSLTAAEPFEIQGMHGKYKVLEIPNMPGEFELTADLRWAVTYAENKFSVLSVADEKVVGEPKSISSLEWKVVGQELVAAEPTGWTHYSIPELAPKQNYPYPPMIEGGHQNTLEDATLSFTRGWYSRGFIFEDDHNKVVATFRGPKLYLDSGFTQYSRRQADSALPFNPSFSYQGLQLAGSEILPLRAIDNCKQRFGPKWFTACGERQSKRARAANNQNPGNRLGYYIEFVGSQFETIPWLRRLHWWGSIPMVADDRFDPAQWTIKRLPDLQPIEANISLDPTSEQSQHELIAALNEATPENVDGLIDDYVKRATPEFELVTGRKPKDLPMAFLITYTATSSSRQVIWTEITKEQILARFGKGLLRRKAEADFRQAEMQNEVAVRQHQQAVQNIQAENARIKNLPPRFEANYPTYAGYAAFITGFLIVAIACAVSLSMLKRRTQATEENDVVLIPVEPPVLP